MNYKIYEANIREKLNADKIKLWIEPFTTVDGKQGELPTDLAKVYCEQLNISIDIVLEILENLRQKAVDKLILRGQSSGIVQLKVKYAGNSLSDKMTQVFSISINLLDYGSSLKKLISEKINLPESRFKLISSGKIISPNIILSSQGLQNNSRLLVVELSESVSDLHRNESNLKEIEKTREAAQLITQKLLDGRADAPVDSLPLEITNQRGESLQLPKEEQAALTLAMTLHEKGRASLKRKKFSESLLLLLEADKEFRKCRADILDSVDNYAILCLDVVWCYYVLKNVDHLPDAVERLRSCEETLNRSYGSDLQRLATIKGSTVSEMILFLKLHILQAVSLYHTQQIAEARIKITLAEKDLSHLTVSDEDTSQIMSLGFSKRETVLGLRACRGDVSEAVSFIMKRREDREKVEKQENEKKHLNKIKKTLGKNKNGDWCRPEVYETLTKLGVKRGTAAEAVRRSNNDLDSALEVLRTQPDVNSAADPFFTKSDITNEMLTQVTSMGFDVNLARQVLVQNSGVIDKTIENLLKTEEFINILPGLVDETVSDISQQEREALDFIRDDLPSDDDEHLDEDLDEMQTALNEYKSLLSLQDR